MSILLIDIGNTRLKWALLAPHGELGEQFAIAHGNWHSDTWRQTFDSMESRPSRILVSNVAGSRAEQALRAAASERWQLDIELQTSVRAAAGVRNGYAEPQQLGVDRWLGVIAAHRSEQRTACVASIGTAMTIDAVTGEGQHLGGLIVPGPRLMIDSLLRGTSDIAARAQEREIAADGFADHTFAAIVQGSRLACAALIERSVRTLAAHEQQQPSLILTGGAADEVRSHIDLPCRVVPDLVLRGLAVLAGETER